MMISMPEDLLKRVDSAAKQRKTSRSGFLRAAAEREMERPERDPEAMQAAIERLRESFGEAPPGDSTEWIRDDRDSRHDHH